MPPLQLLIETSGRAGIVALARGDVIIAEAILDDAKRHARDLAATVSSLLTSQHLKPRDLGRVIVGIGPGSYTGLRVGLASAKALSFALDIPLVPVPTFAAIAVAVQATQMHFDVIADGLQGWVYHQRFAAGQAIAPLTLSLLNDWLNTGPLAVTGPGVGALRPHIPDQVLSLPTATHHATARSLLAAATAIAPANRAEMFALEPLYLRGSSAEEKRHKTQGTNEARVP